MCPHAWLRGWTTKLRAVDLRLRLHIPNRKRRRAVAGMHKAGAGKQRGSDRQASGRQVVRVSDAFLNLASSLTIHCMIRAYTGRWENSTRMDQRVRISNEPAALKKDRTPRSMLRCLPALEENLIAKRTRCTCRLCQSVLGRSCQRKKT